MLTSLRQDGKFQRQKVSQKNALRFSEAQPLKPLSQRLGVVLFVESDQHGFADLHRRGSEVAGWSQHQSDQFVIIRSIFFQIDLGDLFTFGDQHLVHTLQQGERIISADAFFFRVNLLLGINVVGGKKLLRAIARRSSLAVIAPVNSLCHDRYCGESQ